ncbi:MAG: LPS export ABC transporter periplasmic protein LptC [Gemmatimonadota bacterium]
MTRCRSLVVAALPFALLSCAPEEEPPVALEVLRDGVEMAIIKMDHYLTRDGVRRARLTADTAEFRADGEIHMRPVSLVFYDDLGNELSVVTGDFGIYNEQTQNMEAEGSVVALDRRDDQRLVTTRIRYESESDRLFGDEAFTLYRDGGRTVLQGSAFETDPGLSSILMFDSSGRTQQTTRPVQLPSVDSAGAVDDSVEAVSLDSGGVVSDSGGVVSDSGGVASDSGGVVSDSGGVVSDSGGVAKPPDSSRVTTPPDSGGAAPPDTTRTGG